MRALAGDPFRFPMGKALATTDADGGDDARMRATVDGSELRIIIR